MENKSLLYLQAKLEEIHADVKQLKEYVDTLRHESTSRKAVHGFIVSALGILGASVAWLLTHASKIISHF